MSNSKSDHYERVVTDWVKWFRGVNDPDTQRKVAERQIGVLTAEKNVSRYEVIYGGLQVPRVVLHVSSLKALAALQWAMPRMFPKVKGDVFKDDEPAMSGKRTTLNAFLKEMGETRADGRKRHDKRRGK